jgi:hypothetical protein
MNYGAAISQHESWKTISDDLSRYVVPASHDHVIVKSDASSLPEKNWFTFLPAQTGKLYFARLLAPQAAATDQPPATRQRPTATGFRPTATTTGHRPRPPATTINDFSQ